MFEQVLSPSGLMAVDSLSSQLDSFYLAGGTGLALQLGHRRSFDLDFFTDKTFNVDAMLSLLNPGKILYTAHGTIHCEINGIRVSLLYYMIPLVFETLSWRGLWLAHWKDIAAEKLKTVSQRGAKKDFIDLYILLQTKISIAELAELFKRRFGKSGINTYHVLKSLLFFEDAEDEPDPPTLLGGTKWDWCEIKKFFTTNIAEFERTLCMAL